MAVKTADYILREMTDPDGGFYSAQDADSEGVEGKYYVFELAEIIDILGKAAGKEWNQYFDITGNGNFEGKNIPNLLRTDTLKDNLDVYLPDVYQYRKKRYALHLDDYANEIFALLSLYEATLDIMQLEKAKNLCQKAVTEFWDEEKGGFFLYGKENEQLILRPKETYDGAMPSGNSMMAYNLVRLYLITGEKYYEEYAEKQLAFMRVEASQYPAGYAMFLLALSDYTDPPEKITMVLKDKQLPEDLSCRIALDAVIQVLNQPTKEYPLINDRITYYVCRGHSCHPPVNELGEGE